MTRSGYTRKLRLDWETEEEHNSEPFEDRFSHEDIREIKDEE
jgi:hypothetical protein